MDTIGMFQMGQKTFDRLELGSYWKSVIGTPEKKCSMIIYGDSGNGKTSSILRLLKDLCDSGLRATYISHEEGITGSMQDAFKREGIIDNYGGKIILAANATFEETYEYFKKRGSPEVCVIDSIDFCGLTVDQFKQLAKLKNKIIILISWSDGSKPRSSTGKALEYIVDVKLFIKNFMIWPKSRFGGNTPAPVWEERARLLNEKYFARLDKAKLQGKTAKTLFAEDQNKAVMDAMAMVDPVVSDMIANETAENAPEKEGVFADE
ncbi:hypothetical protein J3L18_29560 [Mucilaginibacter gossypii]|uniref:hypothetical protein n=1 Tax=Mucilaginibacter gossypii TaxID=551996 RepID=UPI000DCBE057|nr:MULTISPECIES: hypothetical protein [Mucilaginibacter]QTE37205.1 hypothetical protein J3L18_29560 [Mucilaginibacter gossypii]RAV57168.1 hypothetical protein DIU36_12650 [Mucilaginibacter rubeus]